MSNSALLSHINVPESIKTFNFSDYIDDCHLDPESDLYLYFCGLKNLQTCRVDRALLFTNNPFPGIRTALWLTLDDNARLPLKFKGFSGLWLIESSNSTVMLYGSFQAFSLKNVGGQVVHDVDIFNINAHWLNELATCSAKGKLDALSSDYDLISDQLLVDALFQIEVEEHKESRIRGRRSDIGSGIRSKLSEPDSDEEPITSYEERTLQEIVNFTHPKGWSSDAIKIYFEEKSK